MQLWLVIGQVSWWHRTHHVIELRHHVACFPSLSSDHDAAESAFLPTHSQGPSVLLWVPTVAQGALFAQQAEFEILEGFGGRSLTLHPDPGGCRQHEG